jgi:hypothetical protein
MRWGGWKFILRLYFFAALNLEGLRCGTCIFRLDWGKVLTYR